MKICFLLPGHWSALVGGAEIQVKYIMDCLQEKEDYEIYYVCRTSAMEHDGKVQIFCINHAHVLAKYVLFIDFFQVQKLLRKINPDIIYTRIDTAYVGMAAYYCQRHNCKLMWHIAHQIDVEPYKIKQLREVIKYPDRKLFEYGLQHADIIIGQARYQNKLLQQNFDRSCSAIIPNFHPRARSIALKTLPVRITWVANIKPMKRPELFIKLARALSDSQSVEFIMVGYIQDKLWEEKLETEIAQTPNLTYLGGLPIEEVNELLAATHIFVNTSEAEGFPNSFIQAWLRKVVVVSLDVDPDEVIRNNRLGFVSGNFEQLIKDIRYLIKSPTLREGMAEKCYEYANQHFSLSNITPLLELLKN